MLRSGRWDEAYDALTSALKLESFHYPEASYNLGRLYAARGQNDLAVREWRRVLALDPEHKGGRRSIESGWKRRTNCCRAAPRRTASEAWGRAGSCRTIWRFGKSLPLPLAHRVRCPSISQVSICYNALAVPPKRETPWTPSIATTRLLVAAGRLLSTGKS